MDMAFNHVDREMAENFNTKDWLTQANIYLDLTPTGGEDTADWLSGDQVQQLVTAVNPDAPGASPDWLAGPGPLNFWRTMLGRTVAGDHDRVHIMVVNSENAYELTDAPSGNHWFLVAWLVNSPPVSA